MSNIKNKTLPCPDCEGMNGIAESLCSHDLVEIRQALYGALNHISLYHKEEAESVIEDINFALGLIEEDN